MTLQELAETILQEKAELKAAPLTRGGQTVTHYQLFRGPNGAIEIDLIVQAGGDGGRHGE